MSGSVPPSERPNWPNAFGNWGRWSTPGGTLNLLSAAGVVRAARLIRSGEVFGCGRELDVLEQRTPPEYEHAMTFVGDFRPGRQAAMDRISVDLHSLVNTHLDALSHVGHQGSGFDGVPFGSMVDDEGARVESIDRTPPIVARAVLADIARDRGVDHLDPGDFVRPDELTAAAGTLEPGDVLLVRTGPTPRRRPGDAEASGEPLGDWAGLHVDCMEVIADCDVALLGTDGTTDTFPSPTPDAPSIHMLAEVYLGLPLLHSLDLEAVADACARQGRCEMFFCVAPLRIRGGTGSPVNPVCIL